MKKNFTSILILSLVIFSFNSCAKKSSKSSSSTQTQTYTLVVVANPQNGGSVVLNPSGGVYNAGTVVSIVATAASGYTFTGWSGDLTGTQNPATITMDSNKTVVANFTQSSGGETTYTLTVNVSPTGAGTVSLNPSGGTYTAGTQVTLTAAANSGYEFSNWSGDVSGSSSTITITMDSNKTVTANFTQTGGGGTTYTLLVSIEPSGAGTVSLNPSGGVYTAGTVVQLTAIPNSGYQFDGWSGNLTGTQNPTTITMNSNKTVTANFSQVTQTYTLTTSVSPTGAGTVSLNPSGGVYTAGTQVTLTATANSGYVFSSWSGDLTGTTNPATITMDSNKTVTANFTQQQQTTYTLTTSVSPTGAGTVSLNPSGGTYTAGTVVVLTAQANSGYQFLNWTGDVTGTSNPTTVVMNSNKTVTANFEQIGSDTAKYSFETGVQGWVIQTYTDSQAITNVVQDTTKAKYGSASLKCTVNLIGGHANYSKGETYIDMQTATNMSNVTVSVWVWVPQEAVGDPTAPNGIQIFFKDSSWKSKYSSWYSIGGGVVVPGQWSHITVNTATEQWGWDDGCNMSQVRLVGVKIGTGTGSTATFSGYIWIDSVNW